MTGSVSIPVNVAHGQRGDQYFEGRTSIVGSYQRITVLTDLTVAFPTGIGYTLNVSISQS
jgi:hypothetical protein